MFREVAGIHCERHTRINGCTVWGKMWNVLTLKHWPLKGETLHDLCKTLNFPFTNVAFLFFRRLRKIAKKTTCVSFVTSVCPPARPPEWNDAAATGRTFINLIPDLFSKTRRENSRLVKVWEEKRHFTEHLWQFVIIFRWILLKIRNFWNKICTENQNTHFVFSDFVSP
jgi:hypothetical protein